MRRAKSIALGLCLLCGVVAAARGGTQGRVAAQKSLYERLGGPDAVSAYVDMFIKIAGADNRVNKKFVKTVQPERVRLHFIEQICMLAGGPCRYTGDGMRKAHKNMGLTEGEFAAGLEDFGKALDTFNVPPAEKGELLGALARFKNEMVEVKSKETGTPLRPDFKPAPALPQSQLDAGPAMKGGKKNGKKM